MFQCPYSTSDSTVSALARSIQNQGSADSAINQILNHMVITVGLGREYVIDEKDVRPNNDLLVNNN